MQKIGVVLFDARGKVPVSEGSGCWGRSTCAHTIPMLICWAGSKILSHSMNQQRYLSISELNQLLNATLEALETLCFEGEISEITKAGSGHIYLTIKDPKAQTSCVMWRSNAQALRFDPRPGTTVQCYGKPNVYANNGRLQMIVHRMAPAGEGLLRKKFMELKAKLELEGLFEPARKRPIPFLPSSIGIVTSAQGAAIHDIMVRIRERMPCAEVYVADVRVQGEGAALEIAQGIRRLSESGMVDVIIVARGGGSLEDLWAFNEEVVVRAIFASKVPVVSGVGHEVDTSLSDLVADLRAPTPTAAAEMVVPQRAKLIERIHELESRLSDSDRWLQPLAQRVDELALRMQRGMETALDSTRIRLSLGESRLSSIRPERVLRIAEGRIDTAAHRLAAATERIHRNACTKLEAAVSRLERRSPAARAQVASEQLESVQRRLTLVTGRRLADLAHSLASLSTRLEALSPMRVLERGYSIVEGKDGVVTSVASLEAGDSLRLTFVDGRANAAVTGTSAEMTVPETKAKSLH